MNTDPRKGPTKEDPDGVQWAKEIDKAYFTKIVLPPKAIEFLTERIANSRKSEGLKPPTEEPISITQVDRIVTNTSIGQSTIPESFEEDYYKGHNTLIDLLGSDKDKETLLIALQIPTREALQEQTDRAKGTRHSSIQATIESMNDTSVFTKKPKQETEIEP